MEVIFRYANFYFLGMVPFLTILSYAIYYKKGYYMTELSIFYLYFCGQIAFILVIITPVITLLEEVAYLPIIVYLSIIVFLLIVWLYLIFKMHRQFFGENWAKTVIKSLAIYYTGIIIYGVTAYGILNLIKTLI
jgi:hypothetical protein